MSAAPACHLIGYVVEGILNHLAERREKQPFTAKKVSCIAKGDRYCEFVLEKE